MDFFIKNYFNTFLNLIEINEDLNFKLIKLKKLVLECSKRRGSVVLLGNGGSASIANHIAVDLSKNARIKSYTFNFRFHIGIISYQSDLAIKNRLAS